MANNLEKIRGKYGMSQGELAKKIGVTRQGIFYSEQNKISMSLAKKIADVLGENVFNILGTDALVALPETEEDKEILIEMIKGL